MDITLKKDVKKQNTKKQNKKNAYPTKTTLNLLVREKKGMPMHTLIPVLVLMIVSVGLFCQYGVIARLAAASRAERAAVEAEQALAAAQEELLDYDEVEAEYARYFSDALRSDDMPQECEDVLDVMEEIIMPSASVESLSFSQNTLMLQLNVSSLDVGAEIMTKLYTVPMVDTVTITTASDASVTVSAAPAASNKTDAEEASDAEEEKKTSDAEEGGETSSAEAEEEASGAAEEEGTSGASVGVSVLIMTITFQEVEE